MNDVHLARVAMVRASAASLILFLCLGCLVLHLLDRHPRIAHARVDLLAAASEVVESRSGYVGDAACLPCHKGKTLSYADTAHHRTLQLPGKSSILGSFKEGKNILMIQNPMDTNTDPRLFFKMDLEHG
jgi:hypothetical protein